MTAVRGERQRRLRRWPTLLAAAFLSAGATPAADHPVELIASRNGFQPRVVTVHKGETIRLLLRTADQEHCFTLEALRIEKRILPGKATALDMTAERAGEFPFYCCLESGAAAETERGRLIVTD